jgi:alpha-L-fucosidase
MPSCIRLTVFAFRFGVYLSRSWATKNPAYVAVSRVGKSYGSYDRITCLPKAYRGYMPSDVYSDYLIGSG